jgi:hypothetical protein
MGPEPSDGLKSAKPVLVNRDFDRLAAPRPRLAFIAREFKRALASAGISRRNGRTTQPRPWWPKQAETGGHLLPESVDEFRGQLRVNSL